MLQKKIQEFSAAVRAELESNLIPFWLEKAVDQRYGGFVGRMANDGTVDAEAPKGLIQNARLLWTYSALHQSYKDPRFGALARRAYDYLEAHFLDPEYGGAFWQVDCRGRVIDDKKKIYGQAFYVYSLAEYYRALGDAAALKRARDVFELIEAHSRDLTYLGYIEVCNRDWSIASDLRLSDKDMDEKKSMNNHLHLLEAYANLYCVWPDHKLRGRLEELIELFEQRVADPTTGHLHHFFDETWRVKSDDYTFGHDIEATWLLCEAAEVLGDSALRMRVKGFALRLAKVVLAEGVDAAGGLCYRGRDGHIIDPNREWWPQIESVVGFLNAYQLSGDDAFLPAAEKAWGFIEKYFVDRAHGEWFWRIDPAGRPDPAEPKVSEWKEPYHGVRGCLETIRRLGEIDPLSQVPTCS
jgi:mannobiose 2-epimerase